MGKVHDFIDKILENKWASFWTLVLIGFVIYFQTLFFNFSYLDDNSLIINNQYFLSHLFNIFTSFTTDVFHLFNNTAFYYRPLLTISLIFDYHVGGIHPFIYHFTNVALHIFSSLLVFIFLVKLNYKKILSFLFAVIFLIHPVLTQAVAWIPGRNDSLLAVFVLATFIFFIEYLQEEKPKNIIWALIFFGLAIFTKETGVFIIPVLLYYLIFMYKGKKLSLDKFYFFFGATGILIIWAFLRHSVLQASPQISLLEMIRSITLNLPAVVQFIGKIFLPFNLSVLPIIQDTTFIYGIISLILLGVVIFFTKVKRLNYILLGAGWFIVFLLPSFIRPNTSIVADFIEHRVYVPIIGIFIILLETDFINRINFKKKSTLFIISGLIFALSMMTIIHSRNFVNKLSFWQNATLHSPRYPLAHRNLGAMMYLEGDMDNAEKEFKKALELNPNEDMAHNNLGLIYFNQGKFKESEEEYKKELEINPYYDNAHYNLGLLYWQQKKYDEAVTEWKKTVNITPSYLDAVNALAMYYYNKKDYKEAMPYLTELYRRGVVLPEEVIKLIQLSMTN